MSFGFGFGFGITGKVGIAFSPLSLFADGEVGAWYDPSDLTTMYQNSTGTTPVTAVEQPVGLMLDKSQGLVLGSELVTNGGPDFTSTTGWTGTSTGGAAPTLSIVSGWFRVTANGTFGGWGATTITYPASWIAITVQWRTSGSASAARVTTYFPGLDTDLNGTSGTQTIYLAKTGGSGEVRLHCKDATGWAEYRVISVKALPGNHAKATNDGAARPILRNRYNRLTNSEVFDSGWPVSFASVTANTEVAPNGTTTADTLTVVSNAYPQIYQQALGVINPALYIASVYAKAGTNDQISLELRGPNLVPDATFNLTTGTVVSGSGTIVSAGNGWYRCSVTTTTNTINPLFIIGGKANSAGTVYIWGAQLTTVDDHAAINQEYQSITTATSYNSDATKFPLYMEFDGVDDGISSTNINFSATNQVSAFSAVSKNLVTNFGIVVELSASAGTNNGAFALWINGDTGGLGRNTHGITLRGTTNFYDEAFRPYPAPANAVLSYIFQPGEADQVVSRINGSPVTASSTLNSTSAGNFGNYPLYIGSRGGATLLFGGRLYGLIVRSATSTAQEVSNTETYLSGKSGVAV